MKQELKEINCVEVTGVILQKLNKHTYEVTNTQRTAYRGLTSHRGGSKKHIVFKTNITEYRSSGYIDFLIENKKDTTVVETTNGFSKSLNVYYECLHSSRLKELNRKLIELGNNYRSY